jgi:hypothetical protein
VAVGLLPPLAPAVAQSPDAEQCALLQMNLMEVKRLMNEEERKTERFRTGNKPAFKEIFDARAKAGRQNKADDEKLAAELARRMQEVHAGLPKQIAAMQTFGKDITAATEAKDCPAARRAAEIWMFDARKRIAEYDRYFRFLADMKAGREIQAQPK